MTTRPYQIRVGINEIPPTAVPEPATLTRWDLDIGALGYGGNALLEERDRAP